MESLRVPASEIWLPDIVPFNSADGNHEATTWKPLAVINHDGSVLWLPTAIIKSSCVIDLEFFPFDEHRCLIKFGSWTYDGYMVDLVHRENEPGTDTVGTTDFLPAFLRSRYCVLSYGRCSLQRVGTSASVPAFLFLHTLYKLFIPCVLLLVDAYTCVQYGFMATAG